VPTRYVLYPREPHGLNEREHRLDAVRRVLDWFDRYLNVPDVKGVKERRD
jgi:dipeptidyl aminopeptidase/acylaminoacyl peptidase